MIKLIALAVVAAAAPAVAAAALPDPVMFAPGTISGPANDGSPTFTPDGDTLYFTRSTATWSAILEAHRVHGAWSAPQLAAFSGEWPDSSPALAPDGSYLVFTSIRPRDPAKPAGPRDAQLFRVARRGSGWSAPEKLPAEVNIGASIWKPSIAADGTIYFTSIDAKGHKQLFAAARQGAGYARATALPFSDGTTADVDPEIAPDGSFLVFASSGRVADDPHDHMFIVRRAQAGWGTVQPIRYAGDDAGGRATEQEPHLGADHASIYFASDRAAPVAFPRSHAQAVADEQRLEAWDNSNLNVWVIPLP
jgi:Tol biopolymer transport system component